MEAQPAAPDSAGEMKEEEEEDGPLAEQKLPHDGDDVPPLRGLGDLVRSPPPPHDPPPGLPLGHASLLVIIVIILYFRPCSHACMQLKGFFNSTVGARSWTLWLSRHNGQMLACSWSSIDGTDRPLRVDWHPSADCSWGSVSPCEDK